MVWVLHAASQCPCPLDLGTTSCAAITELSGVGSREAAQVRAASAVLS
jgi:hypothetical protein